MTQEWNVVSARYQPQVDPWYRSTPAGWNIRGVQAMGVIPRSTRSSRIFLAFGRHRMGLPASYHVAMLVRERNNRSDVCAHLHDHGMELCPAVTEGQRVRKWPLKQLLNLLWAVLHTYHFVLDMFEIINIGKHLWNYICIYIATWLPIIYAIRNITKHVLISRSLKICLLGSLFACGPSLLCHNVQTVQLYYNAAVHVHHKCVIVCMWP